MGGKDPEGSCGSKTCSPVEVPTAEEKEALDALRSIKDRVREVKGMLETAEEAEPLQRELEALREKWAVWQKRREAAARKRMVMLGHEDPG